RSASFSLLMVAMASVLVRTSAFAMDTQLPTKVYIEVQTDGKHCTIKKVKVLCTEAISHLRDTLKLPLDTEVGVKAAQAAPYKDVKWVLGEVGKSGYLHPVAFLTPPKSRK